MNRLQITISIPTITSVDAFEYGYDCEINGPNHRTNCHFSIFSSKENTRAWEKGKKAASKRHKPRN